MYKVSRFDRMRFRTKKSTVSEGIYRDMNAIEFFHFNWNSLNSAKFYKSNDM